MTETGHYPRLLSNILIKITAMSDTIEKIKNKCISLYYDNAGSRSKCLLLDTNCKTVDWNPECLHSVTFLYLPPLMKNETENYIWHCIETIVEDLLTRNAITLVKYDGGINGGNIFDGFLFCSRLDDDE